MAAPMIGRRRGLPEHALQGSGARGFALRGHQDSSFVPVPNLLDQDGAQPNSTSSGWAPTARILMGQYLKISEECLKDF
jgi:hypothetical protein